MITSSLLKESFTKSLPSTILLIIAFAIMNSKLNQILVSQGIDNAQIKQNTKDITTIIPLVYQNKENIAVHFGDAYLREEEDEL